MARDGSQPKEYKNVFTNVVQNFEKMSSRPILVPERRIAVPYKTLYSILFHCINMSHICPIFDIKTPITYLYHCLAYLYRGFANNEKKLFLKKNHILRRVPYSSGDAFS